MNKERGKLLNFFFRSRPGPYSAPAESQDLGNQDPVGSPAEVSQTTLATIIANKVPFKAGGLRDCLYVWKTITSDPFILDAVNLLTLLFHRSYSTNSVSQSRGLIRPVVRMTEIILYRNEEFRLNYKTKTRYKTETK